ncbi:MAG TPA: hypothetical protein DIU15_01130, partial [Deltaproteobacteria bacterium]|nr:hypothetical protein [Deltaproteobacteria bacterium]
DPYRWMEDASRDDVGAWTTQRNAVFGAYTDGLTQREWLYDRFQHLWRYDDESTPEPCLLSDRVIYKTKKAEDDKWVVHMREGQDGDSRVLLDPNTWEATEALANFSPSPDCRYAAFGKTVAGNEDPVIRVMDLDTLEVLPDTLRGWKQRSVDWLHDNSGFFYTAKPLEGEVAEGEHQYWHRGWFHRLGTSPDQDQLVASDEEVKETWNGVYVSEDGKWAVRYRSLFNKTELWLHRLAAGPPPGVDSGEAPWNPVGTDPGMPIATGMDAQYWATVVEDRLIVHTDWEAGNYRAFSTPLDRPGREHWTELVPESSDRLSGLIPVDGHLYAVYLHNAATRIDVYSLAGEKLKEMKLPTIGSARVWGWWSQPGVWVSFSSFAHPSSVFTYDVQENELSLYKPSPIDIDPEGIAVEQVWYPSRDGTQVSMFVVHHEDAKKDGSVPFLLTGYGGFNVSLRPRFSTLYAVWIESGGAIAIPNLRGGGEYGRDWHEAGMLERKQNVFDDFIAAAEWLEAEGWTHRDRLAIAGGSNGGLLVSAAVTQRPELFQAVLCAVPLTDMVRFHHLGLANIWTEEYGSADDPEMFPHLLAYSPYHNAKKADYPAILVTGSENDARTDPAHARKFAAAVRWADEDHGAEEPILLSIQGDSGHRGAVTIDQSADQYSRNYGFLMEQIGLSTPAGGVEASSK